MNGEHPKKRTCQHPRLRFGSGDYYLFCADCTARWVMHNGTSPEYGYDAHGVRIGADSSVCTGYVEIQERVAPSPLSAEPSLSRDGRRDIAE